MKNDGDPEAEGLDSSGIIVLALASGVLLTGCYGDGGYGYTGYYSPVSTYTPYSVSPIATPPRVSIYPTNSGGGATCCFPGANVVV